MTDNRKTRRLAGVSAIALSAAAFLAPAQSLACSATESPFAPGDPPMTITCPATDPDAEPFLTSHPIIDGDYDGNSADILIINGGAIVVGGAPVPVAVSVGNMELDSSVGEVNLLGGADSVTMTSGSIGTTGQPLNLNLGEGDNSATISGGAIYGSVIGGDGADGITINGTALIGASIFTNGGGDTVNVGGTAVITGTSEGDAVGLGDGVDTFTMTGGQLLGGLSGGDNGDTLNVNGGSIATYVNGGTGDDQISLTNGASVGGDVLGDTGNDTITIDGGSVAGFVSTDVGNDTVNVRSGSIGSAGIATGIVLGDGADTLNVSGGTVYGSVFGQGGGNTYNLSGGTIFGSVFTGSQNDSVTVSGAADIRAGDGDAIGLEDGDDGFVMLGGILAGSVSGGSGVDTMTMSGGSIDGDLSGNEGNDIVGVTGGSITGGVSGGSGSDLVTMSGGTVAGAVGGGDGSDTIVITNGSVGNGVLGGDGNDSIAISGGSITGNIDGDGEGDGGNADSVAVSGGTITGNVGAEDIDVSGGTIDGNIDGQHVELHGGTITGNISGIGPDTIIIDNVGAVDPLDLANGVVFSGTGANGQITGVDLSGGGAETQNFIGFNTLALDSSTLAFAPGSTQQVNLLTLGNGSTLYAPGAVNFTGSIAAANSTINMVNGVAGDVFTLGGITLNNATLALDLNQQTGQADQLVAGVFGATGANVININLIGTPSFTGETDIPIIVSTGGAVPGTFTITGIPGTPGALFSYSVVQAPGGGLVIRAIPNNFGIAVAPDSAVNSSIVDVAVDALYGINRDALDADLALANGSQRIALTPSFGVFASGQFAHANHDGFDVSTGLVDGPGPSFDANDFSAAVSLDFNAAKHFNFDTQYGLNLGIFGGYASTDVGLDPFLGFADMGDGNNRSGMFGAYALFRKEFNYALVSASAFLGNTDIRNGVLGTTGSYDTQGYAVTGSVGHIFILSDRTRFDLRGGLLGVTFRGDSYTDSGGNDFGESKISFGALQFAPGIYGDFQVGDGMIFSPYARLEMQQRFSARNTAEIDTKTVHFDDADFSAALSSGFNLRMTEKTTLSGELRGKWSSDSSTLGAKLGLKVAF